MGSIDPDVLNLGTGREWVARIKSPRFPLGSGWTGLSVGQDKMVMEKMSTPVFQLNCQMFFREKPCTEYFMVE
jgi:hypothetical protein